MKVQTFDLKGDNSKPYRTLLPFNHLEIEEFMGASCPFQYIVSFHRPHVVAGNHFHQKKKELIVCIMGNVVVMLVNPKTKGFQKVNLDANIEGRNNAVLIPAGIAHAVISLGPDKKSAILVYSTGEPKWESAIEYEVTPRDENHILIMKGNRPLYKR